MFVKRMHEPGAKTVLGKSYAEDGVAQGRGGARRSGAVSPRPRRMSRRSSPSISWRISRRPRWSSGLRRCSATRTAISRPWTVALVKSDEAWDAAPQQAEAAGRLA